MPVLIQTFQLSFHPSKVTCLLSGSTDGLVNIYDTSTADEDDSLIQVFNHGSSIHHAGFLTDADVYALSHDEQLSFYSLASPGEEEPRSDEPDAIVYGDVRPRLCCEYMVDVLIMDGQAIFAAGTHR